MRVLCGPDEWGEVDAADPLSSDPLNDGLVGWWKAIEPLDGGNAVHDLATGHTAKAASLNGGSTWTGSPAGPAISFDGTSGYLSTPTAGAPAAGWVSMWVSPNSAITANTNTGLLLYPSIAASYIIWRFDDGAGGLKFYLFDGAFKSVTTTTTSWAAGAWYKVAGYWTGSTMGIAVNGVVQATAAAGSPVSGSGTWDTRGGNSTNYRYWNGRVAAWSLRSRAPTASDIAADYAASLLPPELDPRLRRWRTNPALMGAGTPARNSNLLLLGCG